MDSGNDSRIGSTGESPRLGGGGGGRPPAPVHTPPPPAVNPLAAPNWAATAAAAPVKKPTAMKRFFSFIWHGGSDADAEARPSYHDMSTGRTDLQNARPWDAVGSAVKRV